MGVRGLTTFIAANAALYLKPHELHDTNLVIDGDNLCVQMFKKSQLKSSALGGNYDVYFRVVVDFFQMLKLANIVPYVLLDGGYEARKMSVVRNRMFQKLHTIKKYSTMSIMSTMPLMMREVFVDAMEAAGVAFMRCAFEADDEVATLARKLNCPVLSYDSDFYIHDVQYIPYVTLTHKVYRKVTDKNGENFKIGVVQRNHSTKAQNRAPEVKFIAQCGNWDVSEGDDVEEYSYLDCCVYTIDHLIARNGQLGKEMVPLFAVLLGNDYIERGVLRAFYNEIRKGRVNRKVNKHQRRLKVILRWLQHHTLQSATRAIVQHIKGDHQQRVYRQILTAMRGYNCESCSALSYFGLEEASANERLEDDDIEKNLNNLLEQDGGEAQQVEAFNYDMFLDHEDEQQGPDDRDEHAKADDVSEDDSDQLSNESDVDANDDDDEEKNPKQSSDENASNEHTTGDHEETPGGMTNAYTDHNWPAWFRELYRAGKVPRFLADLLHSNFYISYPQIEDINQRDNNAPSYPILRCTFAILKTGFKVNRTTFKYVTRKVKRVGLKNIIFENVHLPPGAEYDPTSLPNVTILHKLFEERNIGEWRDLFIAIESLPAHMRLYFLAIVYWAKSCTGVNMAHVYALVLCILQLQTIDKCVKGHNRNVAQFRQQNQTFMEQHRKTFKETNATASEKNDKKPLEMEFTQAFYKQLNDSTPRAELMLGYDWLIGHFSLNEQAYNKRSQIDASIMHTFSSFQSVCYNLYALVPLLGYPLDNLRMHELYNSMFVYNVYGAINGRSNLFEYARTTIFPYSPALLAAHRVMVDFVVKYVPQLEDRKRAVKTRTRASRAKRTANAVPPVNDWDTKNDSSEGEGFIDTNNAFSQLLLAK